MKNINDVKLKPPEVILSEISLKLAEKLVKGKENLPKIENVKKKP